MIGTALAHDRITAALDVGGRGEVWRAEDTKRDGEAAIEELSVSRAGTEGALPGNFGCPAAGLREEDFSSRNLELRLHPASGSRGASCTCVSST
jgi:hypothetical protein